MSAELLVFLNIIGAIGAVIGIVVLVLIIRFLWTVPNILESIEDELIRLRTKGESSSKNKEGVAESTDEK